MEHLKENLLEQEMHIQTATVLLGFHVNNWVCSFLLQSHYKYKGMSLRFTHARTEWMPPFS